MNKMYILIAVTSVCSIVVIAVASVIGFYFGKQSVQVVNTPAIETLVAQAPEMGSIAIPGFDRLVMKAGETAQEVTLDNPQQNNCYFVLSMYLPDGEKIYQSSKLAPGEILNSIELKRPLEAGTYEGVTLRYSCYDIDSLETLNGADVKFKLEVEP